jgi:hypothetical protein
MKIRVRLRESLISNPHGNTLDMGAYDHVVVTEDCVTGDGILLARRWRSINSSAVKWGPDPLLDPANAMKRFRNVEMEAEDGA